MAEARATKPAPKLADVLRSAGKKALDGGIAGALAMVLQMFALISCADHVPWMRTTINQLPAQVRDDDARGDGQSVHNHSGLRHSTVRGWLHRPLLRRAQCGAAAQAPLSRLTLRKPGFVR